MGEIQEHLKIIAWETTRFIEKDETATVLYVIRTNEPITKLVHRKNGKNISKF